MSFFCPTCDASGAPQQLYYCNLGASLIFRCAADASHPLRFISANRMCTMHVESLSELPSPPPVPRAGGPSARVGSDHPMCADLATALAWVPDPPCAGCPSWQACAAGPGCRVGRARPSSGGCSRRRRGRCSPAPSARGGRRGRRPRGRRTGLPTAQQAAWPEHSVKGHG
jgi:hypothetical protein